MDARHLALLGENDKAKIFAEVNAWFRADVESQAGAIRKGSHCYRYVKGNILSEAEMQEIADADKVPVQTTEGIIKVSSMIGSIDRLKKDGIVVGRGGPDAAPAHLRNLLIKDDIEMRSGLSRAERQILQDTLVTGVPTWLAIVPTDPDDYAKEGLHVQYRPWNAVVPDGNWRDPSCRDLRRVHDIKQCTYEELSERWFSGADAREIQQYAEMQTRVSSIDSKISDYLEARSGVAATSTGMVNVIETYYHAYMRERVSIDQFGIPSIIPPTWDDAQIQDHLQATGNRIEEQRRKVLWMTVWTPTGLVLEHGPCWFQDHGFPLVPMVPPDMDGEFVGMIEFCLDTLKELCYLKTERMQGLRTVTNNVYTMLNGAVKNKKEALRQLRKAGGLIELEPDFPRDAIGPIQNQRENQAFNDAILQAQDDLSRLTVERNFEGGAQSSQESSKAIMARVDQGTAKLGFFIDSFHEARRILRSKLVKALPFAYPKERIIRQLDQDTNEVQEHKLNEPVEFDMMGEAIRVKNDLTAGEFDFIYTEADNSVSGREQDRNIFLDFMKNFGNMPPETVMDLALAFPSPSVQKYGRALQQREQAAAQQPPPPPQTKLSVSLDAAALGAEAMQHIAQQANLLPPPAPPAHAGGSQGQAPEGPEGASPEEMGEPPMNMPEMG